MVARTISAVYVALVLLSCGKDEALSPVAPENCDVLSTYEFDVDFIEDYGTTFEYTNWKSRETKSFMYSESASTINVVEEQVLCTQFSYPLQAILIYEDENSTDFIQLTVSSYLDSEYKPMYFLDEVSGIFDGDSFSELRYVNGLQYVFLDEHRRLVYHETINNILFGFDDRQGNQWLKTGSNASIFYCETRDNIDAYLESETAKQFSKLFEIQDHKYTDGFAPSYTFQPSSYTSFSNFIGEEPIATCVGGELEIQEFKTEFYDYRIANAYSLNYSLTTGFESVNSDNHYTLFEIRLHYLLNFQELYSLRFVLNDAELYEPQSYEAPLSDYLYHETLELNGNAYTEVYQFEYKDRLLFFNTEYGVLAFTDHLDVRHYLIPE